MMGSVLEVKIGFKIKKELKLELQKAQKEDSYRYYNDYIRDIIKDYLHTGEYERMNLRKSELSIDKENPACLPISKELYDKIEEVREVVNRNRSEFIAMILTDFMKKRRRG